LAAALALASGALPFAIAVAPVEVNPTAGGAHAVAVETPSWLRRPREGALRWGVYQDIWGRRHFARSLDEVATRLGGSPELFLFYRDLRRPIPTWAVQEVAARGAVPVVSLELTEWHGGAGNRLEALCAGTYDEVFRDAAAAARESGTLILLRFGFEMNGDWFPWGGQPARFIEAWRRIHEIFRDERCDNVKWVWAPNAISGPNTPENGIEKYWPGEDVVDIIGLDGYNFGDRHSRWHRWTSCEDIFRPALDKILESGVRQPVLITEFGCASDPPTERRAEWVRSAHRFFASRPEIVGVIWFNYDKRAEGEPDWRIDSDERSLAAWRETFMRPS